MSLTDKERIINRYNERIEKFGGTIEALASGNEERRKLRFDVLFECGISKNDRILDLGCGFGDFYSYLNDRLGEGNFKYTGVDINPTIIEYANSRFPSADFRAFDILSEELNDQFDFVVSTSSFNNKMINISNYDFAQQILNKCYAIAEKGVAIDFLTKYVDFESTVEAFYYEPEIIFSSCKEITKRVALRHDYPLFEFCIYLYKDFKGWAK